MRPWSRNVPETLEKQNEPRNQDLARTITKSFGTSKEYLKDPVFTTTLISSSDEYIKDETARLDSLTAQSDEMNDAHINPSDYFTAPQALTNGSTSKSSRFSPPNKIYFGFKPVVTRYFLVKYNYQWFCINRLKSKIYFIYFIYFIIVEN